MLQIVVPMAGRGSRFSVAGYSMPKPLIPVHGVPMIQLVIANLRPRRPHRFTFLCLEQHLESFPTERILREHAPECEIVAVHGVTQGAACTVLLAKQFIDNDDELMIANSDQWVDFNVDDYLAAIHRQQLDGLIMTMRANDPKWSFVRLDKDGLITEVAEKQVISNEATVGIYSFRRGSDFVSAAERMIEADMRVNGEFYVAPVYNMMIEGGRRVSFFNVGAEGHGMYGLGIPADLDHFQQLAISKQAVEMARNSQPVFRAA